MFASTNSGEHICRSTTSNRKPQQQQQYGIKNHWKLCAIFFLMICHKTCYGDDDNNSKQHHDQQDFQFDTNIDDNLQIVLTDEDESRNRTQVTIYENELSNCPFGENKIVLSLLLKSNTWNDITNKKQKKAIQKLSTFFGIPNEYITLDTIYRRNLYDMTKTSIRQGIYQLSNNKKLGKLEFMIGCGKLYFTSGQLIANQIAQQMNDGSINDISGLEFGWWLIWAKQINSPRIKRDAEPEESSGEYDDYNYDDDEWEGAQVEPTKKTPNKNNEISNVDNEEHPHRHHHGDNALLTPINNKQSNIVHDNLASKQSTSLSSSSASSSSSSPSSSSSSVVGDFVSVIVDDNDDDDVADNSVNKNNIIEPNKDINNKNKPDLLDNLDNLDKDIKNGVLKLESDITKTIQNNNNKLKEVQQEIDEILKEKKNKLMNKQNIYDDIIDGIIDNNDSNIDIINNMDDGDGGTDEINENYDINPILSETVPDDEFLTINKYIQNDPDNDDYVVEDVIVNLDKSFVNSNHQQSHQNDDNLHTVHRIRTNNDDDKNNLTKKIENSTVKRMIETTTLSNLLPLTIFPTSLPPPTNKQLGINNKNKDSLTTTEFDAIIGGTTIIPINIVNITDSSSVIQFQSQHQTITESPLKPQPTKQQMLYAVMTTAKADNKEEESTTIIVDNGSTSFSSISATTTIPLTVGVTMATMTTTQATTIIKDVSSASSIISSNISNNTSIDSNTTPTLEQITISTPETLQEITDLVTSPTVLLTPATIPTTTTTTTTKQQPPLITTPTKPISTEKMTTEIPTTIIVTELSKSSNPTEAAAATNEDSYDDDENDDYSETTISSPNILNVLPISNYSTTEKSTTTLLTTSPLSSSKATILTTKPATTTSTTTTTTTQLTTEFIDPEPANYPPTIRNRLPKLPVTAGKVFSLHVPLETFFDTEDGTNLKLNLLDKNDNPLKYNSWIQFNQEKREIYGLPLEDAVSKWQFKLLATDTSNETVIETLDISVQQHKAHRSANHEISIGIKLNEKFTNFIDWQILLIRGIGDITRDNSLSSIVVREVRYSLQDPTIATFIYTNDSLPKDKCPDEQLETLFQSLTASNLAEFVQPHMSVKFVNGKPIGPCAKSETIKPKPKPTPHMTKNYPPVPRNQVDRVNATIGQLLIFKVPADTFYDPEDNTDLKLSLLSLDRKPLDPKHWLQFDVKNHEFYGIPKYGDAGQKEYLLVAEDREGLTATDALVVVVGHPQHREYNSLFEMTLGMSHDDFNNSIIQRRFVEKIAHIFGDQTTSNVQIRAIRKIQFGKTMINYYNTTLYRPHHVCPNENIEQLRKVLVHQDGNIRHRVKDLMGAEFDVTKINIAPMGACAEADATIHHASIPIGKTNDNKTTGFKDDYLLTFVLPAVIIIVMLLIATIIACVLHRRRMTGKMELGDEEERKSFRSKGIPVIFQDELDEKPEIGNKSPIILKDEKPPLLPPSYNSTNPDDQEDMDEYVPPPAVIMNGRESRGKSPVTPSYRKPPPYVSP